ncbi:MAG: ribosome-associated translation inhibitor RaiA [Planctomycetota bacterium]|nr:MAG: ribosome-associated translation inhibitor RaiA [Planctomycetota bacterium]
MNVKITGRHIHVSEPLKLYASEKLQRLERHNDLLTDVDVVMTLEGEQRQVELIGHVKVGGPLVAKANHDDMYAAVDLVLEKFDRQLNRHKEKVKQEHHHDGAGRLGQELQNAATAAEQHGSEEEEVS